MRVKAINELLVSYREVSIVTVTLEGKLAYANGWVQFMMMPQ